jgi:nitrogen fixation NifU-like protein
MMDELRELYQDVILDHGKKPRNFGGLEGYNHLAQGHNPMCGDTLVVYLKVDDDNVIQDVSFKGKGCAISVASASMMTEILKGKPVAEAETLFNAFHDMCTQDDPQLPEGIDEDAVERLQVLSGVREFPVRVKCATLAWHTMEAAVHGNEEISTE